MAVSIEDIKKLRKISSVAVGTLSCDSLTTLTNDFNQV